jgi:signal peptidase
MNTFKKIMKIVYEILFVLLLIVAGFIILTSFKVIKGYNFYVVMSGSMEPNIHTGSVVTVKEENDYNVGDVITSKIVENPGQTYSHRIVRKDTLNEQTTYTTKGDANESSDPDVVTQSNVVGKVLFSIPVIGYVLNFAKQPTGFILMVVVPTIIIISSEINTVKGYIVEKVEKRKLNSKKEENATEN